MSFELSHFLPGFDIPQIKCRVIGLPGQELRAVSSEDSATRRTAPVELPQLAARRNVPQPERLVPCAGYGQFAVRGNIQGIDLPLMSFECSDLPFRRYVPEE